MPTKIRVIIVCIIILLGGALFSYCAFSYPTAQAKSNLTTGIGTNRETPKGSTGRNGMTHEGISGSLQFFLVELKSIGDQLDVVEILQRDALFYNLSINLQLGHTPRKGYRIARWPLADGGGRRRHK